MSMFNRFELYSVAPPPGMDEDGLRRFMLDEVFPAVPVQKPTRVGVIMGQQLLMRRNARRRGRMAWSIWSGGMEQFKPNLEDAFEKIGLAKKSYEDARKKYGRLTSEAL